MSEIDNAGAFCAGIEESVGSGGNFHQTYAQRPLSFQRIS
jgi:hypothetical protein